MLKEISYSNDLNHKLLKIKIQKLEGELFNLKKAYPNEFESMNVPGEHNLLKWVQALKDIYYKHYQSGMAWKTAMDSTTEEWNPIEKLDFSNWVSYYQQGGHLKYKKASGWYEGHEETEDGDQRLVYTLPNAMRDIEDPSSLKQVTVDDVSSKEKSKLLAQHKKKVISRLDSIEKLLRSEEGYLLSEKEYDSLMESIHSLKKKVYHLQKKTSGDLFLKDLIVREANVMASRSFFKAASLLYVVAEEKAPAAPSEAPAPAKDAAPPAESQEVPAPVPSSPGGVTTPNASGAATAGTMPAAPIGPDTTPSPNVSSLGAPPLEAAPTGAVIDATVPAAPAANDPLKDFAKRIIASDDLVVDEMDLYSFAQDAAGTPPAAPTTAPEPAPAAEAPEPAISVTEHINFDQKLDGALGSVRVEDILEKINQISKIFKTREIPRQLSIVDMMLDHLGLASYFPSLSEATNKALEANNYILTRLEEIAMQLSGAVKSREIDLTGEQSPVPEQVVDVKENLEEQAEKEKKRKEMRKELAEKAIEERAESETAQETPDLEVSEEDLEAAPPAAQAAPPPPAAPPQATPKPQV